MAGRNAEEIMRDTAASDPAVQAAFAMHSMATPETFPGHVPSDDGYPCEACLRAGEQAADMASSILGAEGIDLS